ncbi:putative zinc finger dna-binding protein [Botrytis fragariae]|uniref:Putative zinc finger dna-binding protein n=1 Tax=Botrytis fragariae TaxID=1964551 RepID=A0A8H6AMA5_9HELO|nr:putative zinc finger dna-binding protein [Botrytis fragariae]KAF5870024.1 putative zinc finger dna-binding protein [Botrytis fragariae]
MSTKTNKREAPARDRTVQDLSVSTQGPRPGYFIVRKTGQVVPLVAVDELPPGVDLIGVPRNLDLVETGGMLNLGLQEGAQPGAPGGGGFYGLVGLEGDEEGDECDDEDGVVGSSGSDTAVSSPLVLPIRSSTLTTATNTKNLSAKLHSPPGLLTSIHAPSRNATSTLETQQQGQQQTCRHWCTHNRRCKWAENCRYKHEMPRTRFELRLIGLSDWPNWFKAENLGFFPGYGRGVERLRDLDVGGGMERKERERRSSRVGREVERGSGIGVLEGERVLERLREMEKLLRGKVVAGKGRDEKRMDVKFREEKRVREKEKEKLKERERERVEKLDVRKAEAKKERERMRIEKAREREASNRIDRGDLDGTRKWEDDSEEDSDDEGNKGGGNKKLVEQVEKSKGSGGEKEKLVDV